MRSLVLSVLIAFVAGAAPAQTRPAHLTVDGDIICTYPNFVDHQISTDNYDLVLPETSGAVSAQGSYVNNGTGYVLSGISAMAGEVRDDAELVLTYQQWNWQGDWMPSSAPFVPTAGQPVTLPLEPGGEATNTLVNATVPGAGGASCSGRVTYRIDFERETQVWDVALKVSRQVLYRNLYGLRDSETGAWSTFDFIHGVTFHYDLGARVTIEKRKGAWTYRDGQVTAASASYDYEQTPELYTILGSSCVGCAKVAALTGRAIGGETDGKTLSLDWPGLQPVVHIDSRFAVACAPGPRQASCERLKKDGSRFSSEDDDTFQRAWGHELPLKPGPHREGPKPSTGGASKLTLVYDYTLTRVK